MNNSWLSMADGHLDAVFAELFPLHSKARVIVTHTRPELLAGVLARGDP